MRVRFAIRDLLWLTVVASLAVGWWLEHSAMQRKQDRLAEQLAKASTANKGLTMQLAREAAQIRRLTFVADEAQRLMDSQKIKSPWLIGSIPDRSSAEERPVRVSPEPPTN